MFKGFLSGLFWGGMVGALVLAVLSLYAPLPATQADAGVGAQAPAAVAEPEVEPEIEPVVEEPEETPEAVPEDAVEEAKPEQSGAIEAPQTETTSETTALITNDTVEPATEEINSQDVVAAAEGVTEIDETSPEVSADLTLPTFEDTTDINAVKLPQVGDGGVETPTAPNAIAAEVTEPSDQPLLVTDKPISTLPVAVLKTSPEALGFADSVSVRTTPNLSDANDEAPQTITSALAAPVISELAPKPVENPEVVRVAVRPKQRVSQLPQIGGDQPSGAIEVSADTPVGVQVAPIENPVSASALQVVTGRLPTVGGATSQSTTVVPTSTPAVETPSRGALSDHAAQFATNAQSLFSIVIIDVGSDGVAREQLLNSSYPITVAIDPVAPDAAAVMSQYRAAGIEVVALLNDLPRSAEPGDVAVAVTGFFGVMDQAVAVMEPLDKRLQRDRNLLQPVLGAISDTGHGLMTYSQGLNTTQQSAKRLGVPSAAIFRVLDAENENATKIKRYLKRAAFNAGKDGSVVVVGRSYPETMTAILEWALENNDTTLGLAPVSAILKADKAQGS